MISKSSGSYLTSLQNWYWTECNGDWEHQYGVRIGTLDNPGWSIDIDLWDTSIVEKKFDEIIVDRSDRDWIRCKVEDAVFKARGGAQNLEEMVGVFMQWVDAA